MTNVFSSIPPSVEFLIESAKVVCKRKLRLKPIKIIINIGKNFVEFCKVRRNASTYNPNTLSFCIRKVKTMKESKTATEQTFNLIGFDSEKIESKANK
jgi:hypothetical protein